MGRNLLAMLLLTFFSINTRAQETELATLDLDELCQNTQESTSPLAENDFIVVDGGFCEAYLKKEIEEDLKHSITNLNQLVPNSVTQDNCDTTDSINEMLTTPAVAEVPKWKIRFYLSTSYTKYFNSTMHFDTSRYQVEVKDYQWAERSSHEYFNPNNWFKAGGNSAKVYDEPSNTFTLSLEKNGHEFFLSAFHSKYSQQKNQSNYMSGMIDGTEIDRYQPLTQPFVDYYKIPGESDIVINQNTHRQYAFDIGYGYRFKLLNGKFGSLVYTPSASFSLMAGHNYSIVIKPHEWWEADKYQDTYGIEGYGVSLKNRLEYNLPGEKVGLFYENRFSTYHMHHGFLDGTQTYNLSFMGNSIGVKFLVYNPFKKK